MNWYTPDFDSECRICGTSPTVHVVGHKQPDTELCGVHFFNNPDMKNHDDWNEAQEETDDD